MEKSEIQDMSVLTYSTHIPSPENKVILHIQLPQRYGGRHSQEESKVVFSSRD